jgi:RHS repeat-associated protein
MDYAVHQPLNLTLTWNAASGSVDEYEVQWQLDGRSWSTAPSTSVQDLDAAFSTSRPYTDYKWRVRGVNAGGAGNWSATYRFRTVPKAPGLVLSQMAEPAATSAALSWEDAYPSVKTQTYDGTDTAWQSGQYATQSLSSEEARSGVYSWKVVSSSGCTNGCAYATNRGVSAANLNPEATMVFSAWVKAPAMHDNINIQLKYKANGTWEYPGGMGQAFYTGGGEWQRLEARLDLSQIAGLESVQAITRNAGSNSVAAYWDDVQLMTVEPAASSYDVQVATDADFTDLIKSQAGQSAQSLEVGALAKGTNYHWRVRAQNATGPGAWSERSFQTIDRAPRRYYVKDHLGSIRAVVDPDASGSETEKVVETRDYYPFGLRMPGRSVTPGTETAEDYTGHELDAETGMHYAGARYYMSALGRFGTRDPMSDSYHSHSPYHYAANNPVRILDPSGKFWVNAIKSTKDVRAGRIGRLSAYLLEEVHEVPGLSRLVFTAGRKLWTTGNSDYSAMNPGWRDWVSAAASAYSQLSKLPPGRPSSRFEDPNHKSQIERVSEADELTFKTIADLVRDGKGPKVSVGDESYDLVDDIGGGDQAFSLGLNTELKHAWEREGSDAIEGFANELGKYQAEALNIIDKIDGEENQRKLLRQWIQAKEHIEDN